MNCDLVRSMIEPLLDGELDATRQAMVREHLAGCAACHGEYREVERLRAAIQGAGLYAAAPAALRELVVGALRASDWRSGAPWRSLAVAASVLLAVSLGANMFLANRSSRTELADDVLAEHVRSMMANHLVDVVSSDRHTVKPWFSGKLDFSPVVKDLAAQGFALSGGRVDYMDQRPVAALVFLRQKHVITLFTWPEARGAGGEALTRNGYNVVEWRRDGMVFWAVSDLNLGELETFARMYRE